MTNKEKKSDQLENKETTSNEKKSDLFGRVMAILELIWHLLAAK